METIQTYRWNTPPVVELPRVTILIPVFNEEVGVEKTIMSALNQVGVSLQVIVINDGSIDNTAVILDELSAKYSNLQVIHKANTGKADSLNVGLSYVATPTYFTTDGDTILHRMAISRLLETLNDRSVGAVGGQVIVGNQKLRVLTALQALEYCNLGISFYLSIAGKGFVAPGADNSTTSLITCPKCNSHRE